MLIKARFRTKYRCFEAGEQFEFRRGVNILVGDQGAGKSTLIQQIVQLSRSPISLHEQQPLQVAADEGTAVISFDFEKDNPRKKSLPKDQERFGSALATHFMSHGQMVNRLLDKLDTETSPATFLMDEPDMALSIRSVKNLADLIESAVARGHQIVASAHNPLLIGAFEEVLSLEHRCWMSSKEFIRLHMS